MLAVTAPFEDVATEAGIQARAGATYLFDLSASPPSYERIVAPNADAGDGDIPPDLAAISFEQGYLDWSVLQVALTDTTLVVGAPAEASASQKVPLDNSAPYAGAVYVYDRTRPGSEPQYIKAPNAHTRDLFGFTISISSTWLAIGAPGESSSTRRDPSNGTAPMSGAVYVYHRSSERMPFDEVPIYIKAPAITALAAFGTTVAMSEDLLVVGAPNDGGDDPGSSGVLSVGVGDRDSSFLSQSGTVFIYRRSGDGWTMAQSVKATKAQSESYFGTALSSISAGAFAVGAPRASGCHGQSGNPTNQGAAYFLHVEEGVWKESCVEPDVSDQMLFGFAVGLIDNQMVVGAPWDSRGPKDEMPDPTTGAGATYLFGRANDQWSGQYFKTPRPSWSAFGALLTVAPGYLVAGAPDEYDPPRAKDAPLPTTAEPPASGAVYVYALEN